MFMIAIIEALPGEITRAPFITTGKHVRPLSIEINMDMDFID